MNLLDELLSSPVKATLLRVLFAARPEGYHLRELTRLSGRTLSAVQRELDRLVRLELVERKPEGNRIYFRANEAHPCFPELRGLVRKSGGEPEALAEAFSDRRIRVALIYGPAAAGQASPGSPVDVLVLGHVPERSLVKRCLELSETLGREFVPHLLSQYEFARMREEKNPALAAVLAGSKQFIVGDEQKLAEFA